MVDYATQLKDMMGDWEWYDNHRIEMILACLRKAYYHLIGPVAGPGPLTSGVGSGAWFGSAMHAAHQTYYTLWGKQSETTRRYESIRAFSRKWVELFPNGPDGTYHSEDRGVSIWDAYCDNFLAEDDLLKPIDAELGFVTFISPRADEPPFVPFNFIGRTDGIFERVGRGDHIVDELKTTSGGAARRLRSLKISRQPIGYVTCLRQLDPRIVGHLGDVILVAAQKIDFKREMFFVSQRQSDSWRRQTINIVEDWRRLRREATDPNFAELDVDRYYMNTEECFKYGQCSFYDLCDLGISQTLLNEFEVDTWNPLLPDVPRKIALLNPQTEAIDINTFTR